jgi:hypothetical protein
MFTTGSKLLFGAMVLAIVGFVAYGLSSSWELFGCMVLGSVAVVTGFLGGVTIAFRDANLEGAALEAVSASDAEGRHAIPGTGVPGSIWPAMGGFGAALTAIGLVLDWRLFVLGLAVLGATLIEWMVQAWADRASSDLAYNARLRGRVMHPLEFPILGVAIAGLVVFGFSRIMLAVDEEATVFAFIGIAVVVLAAGAIFAARPKLTGNVLTAVLVVGAVGILVAGIVGIGVGERSFEHLAEEENHGEFVSNNASLAGTVVSEGGQLSPGTVSIPRSLTVNIIFENGNDEGAQRLVIEGPEVTTTDEEGNEVTAPQHIESVPVEKGRRVLVTFRIGEPGDYRMHTEGDGPEAEGTVHVS